MTDSHIEMNTFADGTDRLARHWPSPDPVASVLIVHGTGEHSGRYEHVGEFFARHGLDTYSYDHRSHGGSGGARGEVDWYGLITDLAGELDAVRGKGRPVVLWGHSLGGLIVLDYVLNAAGPQPDLLVSSAPALAESLPAWQKSAIKVLARVAPRLKIPVPVPVAELSTDPEVGRAYLADPLIQRKGTLSGFAEFFVAQARANATLARLAIPTLVVHGGSDVIVPTSCTEPLNGLPGVNRIVYEGMRHELHNEPDGDRVLADMVSWVKDRLA
jgi:alpha-beta hydrolase superfamily lysophospholipase